MAAFKPYLLGDRASFATALPMVAAAPTFCGVLALYAGPFMPGLQMAVSVRTCLTETDSKGQFFTQEGPLQDVILKLKSLMLEHGGTPEAVRLVNDLAPFTKKELLVMAAKLAKNGAAAPKAEKAPKANKPRGNTAGLEKAREARAGAREEMRARKIKALKKVKDIAAREGSFRYGMLEALLTSKTVGDFYDASPEGKSKYDAGCLRFAQEEGYIELA